MIRAVLGATILFVLTFGRSSCVVWPQGTYGLPKPVKGCPAKWKEGWRQQELETTNPKSRFSSNLKLHMDATISSGNKVINQSFCIKLEMNEERNIWPAGSYCIYKKKQCSSGMKDGSIRWPETYEPKNANAYGGILPDGTFERYTLINYCCQAQGQWKDSIELPVEIPFYLFPYIQKNCQRVKGAIGSLEYIYYDTEEHLSQNSNEKFGTYPSIAEDLFSKFVIKMYYCYYKGCNNRFHNNSGTISVKNFPDYQYCSWSITVDVGSVVSLNFTSINIPNCSNGNHMNIYDGLNDTAPLIKSLCDTYETSDIERIFTSGNNLFIALQSGNSQNMNFNAIYFAIAGPCPSEKIGSPEAYGVFNWPQTSVGSHSRLACPYNHRSFARRECLYATETKIKSVWGPIVLTKCDYREKRSKEIFLLVQKTVTSYNVVKIAEQMKNLSIPNPKTSLHSGDIRNIATVLEKIAGVKHKANEILDDFACTIDNLLDASAENIIESQSSSRVVKALNDFAETLVIGKEGELKKVTKNFAIELKVVQAQNFSGLKYPGVEMKPGKSSLLIPRTIFNESAVINSSERQTIIFIQYKETKFFRVSLEDTTRRLGRLNSLVLAGSIKGLSVKNLNEPIKIAFKSISQGDTNSTLCSYWNFDLGNWSQDGCRFEHVLEDGRILCSCDHFTNFAMLMDCNPTTANNQVLSVVSYVGCAMSLVGLTSTIITILILKELRSKIPSQILLNFCISLSLTLIIFMAAVEKSKTSSLAGCMTAAIALHYFLLASFSWMAVEAYNMYLAFVKVFPNSTSSKFILKSCLFAWGTPAVIVSITMATALDKYGDETYCRLQGIPFIVAFLIPVIFILVGNTVAFCFIIRSLLKSGTEVTSDLKRRGFQQTRQGIAIMVLLGLTWLFGVLAIDDAKLAFQYLFCIFNTLQGFLVFVLFCILPDGTRQQLKKFIRAKTTIARRRMQPQPRGAQKEDSGINNMALSTTDLSNPAILSTSGSTWSSTNVARYSVSKFQSVTTVEVKMNEIVQTSELKTIRLKV